MYTTLKAEIPSNPRAAYREGWQDCINTLKNKVYQLGPMVDIITLLQEHSNIQKALNNSTDADKNS